MAMVYNISEVVKDWLIDRNVPRVEVCVVALSSFRRDPCTTR